MNRTIISILGGLSGMFGWGISDFFANQASDKLGHTRTFIWSQIAGFLLILFVFFGISRIFSLSVNYWLLIVIGAVSYTFGYLFFYKGFEIGNVSVVSALINIQNVLIIGISYFLFKQTVSQFQILGIMSIIIGASLVSINFKDFRNIKQNIAKGAKEASLAAILFGGFYWPLNEYLTEHIDWILLTLLNKFVSILLTFIILRLNKTNIRLSTNKSMWLIVLLIGILEAMAVLGVTFGQAYGDLILVGPISSGLTIVTVALSVIFLKEKVNKQQIGGIVCTVFGVIMTAF